MGTSLSGLTPATTFDGLLKTSDNEPLDGTLKAISTGDGTDTILSLSNSALQIGGDTSIGSSDNTSGSNALVVQNSDGTQLLAVRNDGRLLLGTSSNLMYLDGSVLQTWQINNTYLNAQRVGIGVNSSGNYQLHVKGIGATSATTSLLVQNSAGTELLKVQDDGIIDSQYLRINGSSASPTISAEGNVGKALRLGNEGFFSSFNYLDLKTWDGTSYSPAMRITGNTNQFVGIGETTPTARLHVKAGTTQDTIARFQDPLNASTYIDIKNDSVLTDYVGLFWGNKAKIRSKQVGPIFMDCSGGISFLDGNSAKSNINSQGAIAIGATAVPASTMAYIKGLGATSATTALLVQNSAGSDILKLRDDRFVEIKNGISVQHTNYGNWFEAKHTNNQVALYGYAIGGQDHNLATRSNYSGSNFRQFDTGFSFGAGALPPNTADTLMTIKGTGNDNTTTALLVQNSDGTELMSIDDDGASNINGLTIGGSILTYKPVNIIDNLTATGRVAFGTSSLAAGIQATIKGSGATSATTALLVQNSAGTELMKVEDGGNVTFKTGATINATTYQCIGSGSVLSGVYARVNNTFLRAGGQGINISDVNTTPDDSAQLQVSSTTKGFLPPRMTTTERDAITTPAAGLMVYNTDTNTAECWNGSAWMPMF